MNQGWLAAHGVIAGSTASFTLPAGTIISIVSPWDGFPALLHALELERLTDQRLFQQPVRSGLFNPDGNFTRIELP